MCDSTQPILYTGHKCLQRKSPKASRPGCFTTCSLTREAFGVPVAQRIAIAIRLEAIAIRVEAIAIRLEAIAVRLEAIAIR